MLLANQVPGYEKQVRGVLDNIGLPPSVVDYRLRFDDDWTGEPSVYIYFILSDDLSDAEFLQEARNIRWLTLDPLWQGSEGLNPYTRFRQKHEQDEEDRLEAKRHARIHRRSKPTASVSRHLQISWRKRN